ncbi:cytochrome P450 [Aspergillus pseudoustus]|uniref:Cytochrome P450 n=1 Tax=Aspergillus pseudoustus TaxID=1810923 RepID=A0ABR4K3Z0_9EURO
MIETLEPPILIVGLAACTLALVAVRFILDRRNNTNLPNLNKPRFWDVLGIRAKQRFVRDGGLFLQQGLQNRIKACRVYTHIGWVYLLNADYADLLKNNPKLSIMKFNRLNFQAKTPGFEVYKEATHDDHILDGYSKTQMTIPLGNLVNPISLITATTLQKILGNDKEWRDISLQQAGALAMAGITGRLFYGPEVATDRRVSDAILRYTESSLAAASELHVWPKALQPIIHWFLPSCQRVRADLRHTCKVLEAAIKRQKLSNKSKGNDVAEGTSLFYYLDHISKKAPKNRTHLAIFLSMTGSHTTSMLLTSVLANICEHPTISDELRKEIIEVVGEYGWTKQSMEKLRLMDSVMKETLRLLPPSQVVFRRIASETVQVDKDLRIPKGSTLMVSAIDALQDPARFPEPEKFDPYRFVKLAQTGSYWARASPFVATSSENLGFGLGKDACPGRFLVNAVFKIYLSYLLLHYDVKLPDWVKSRPRSHLFNMTTASEMISVRRRPNPKLRIDAFYSGLEQ